MAMTTRPVSPPRVPARVRVAKLLAVTAGTLFVIYLAGYVFARGTGRLMEFAWSDSPFGSQIGDPPAESRTVIVATDSRFMSAPFRPCVAVEEWWLNRDRER